MLNSPAAVIHKARHPREFLNNTLVNAAGIAAGQLLVLLAMPILARQYSPAAFGVYASLVAVSGVIATGAALRLEAALPATEDGETPTMYRLGLSACGISLVVGILFATVEAFRSFALPQALSGTFLAMLCISTGALHGILLLAGAALTRSGNFVHLAILRIIHPAGFVVAALLQVPGGLPVAFTIGVAGAAVCGLAFSWRQLVAPARYGIARVARKYREFPMISLPMAILDTLALALPLLYIAQHYGESAAGNYSQIQRLAAAPLLLFSAAIAQVFYKHAGDISRSGSSVRPLMWKTIRNLGISGIVLLALAAAVGDPVLSLFLGKAWRTDTGYLLLILIPVVVRTSVSPITSVILLSGQLRLGAAWQILYAASTVLVLHYMTKHFSLDQLLFGVLVNEIVMYLIYLWVVNVAVHRLERRSSQCAA